MTSAMPSIAEATEAGDWYVTLLCLGSSEINLYLFYFLLAFFGHFLELDLAL